jgi:hypothetical protein
MPLLLQIYQEGIVILSVQLLLKVVVAVTEKVMSGGSPVIMCRLFGQGVVAAVIMVMVVALVVLAVVTLLTMP